MKEASSSQNIVRLLEKSGIRVDMTVPDIAKRLCKLLVGEWLNNSDRYQPFLPSSLQSQATPFLQSGHFMGELGNTMPLLYLTYYHCLLWYLHPCKQCQCY